MSFSVVLELQEETGAYDMSTVPQRASRVTDEQEHSAYASGYDDPIAAMPRSQVRFRPTQTDTQPLAEGDRGRGKGLLWLLLILCIAFLVSGIQTPFLAGNTVTIHIPIVWIVACVAIVITSIALIKSR